jgi:hypothetical protein
MAGLDATHAIRCYLECVVEGFVTVLQLMARSWIAHMTAAPAFPGCSHSFGLIVKLLHAHGWLSG